jgi:hypothetical protein
MCSYRARVKVSVKEELVLQGWVQTAEISSAVRVSVAEKVAMSSKQEVVSDG